MRVLASVRRLMADLTPAGAFYRHVVGLVPTFEDDASAAVGEAPMVVVDAVHDDAERAALVGRLSGIGFRTADALVFHTLMTGPGVRTLGPPKAKAWGGTLLHVADLSGHAIPFLQDDRASQTS